MKIRTNILIEETSLRAAQESGLNISKICEKALNLYIKAIKTTDPQIEPSMLDGSAQNNNDKPRAGFEPATPALPSCRLSSDVDWVGFEKFLNGKCNLKTVNDRLSYAKTYYSCLVSGDFSVLSGLTADKCAHVLKALSSLSKFLGCYQDFLRLKNQYGLKWVGRSSDELIIDRLNKVRNPDDVFEWVRKVKRARPELADFMDLMAVSGLRFIEAVESYNMIIKLKDHLDQYYNNKNQILEHYKFKEVFLRKNKKALITIVPVDLVNRISDNQILTLDAIRKRVQKTGLALRFGDVREAHGTYLTKYLKEPEINFLHGRVGTSVFMRNYFNPQIVDDLKARALQGIGDIMEKVKL
jgi:post-segregation antitoxin (ccd killing protein)